MLELFYGEGEVLKKFEISLIQKEYLKWKRNSFVGFFSFSNLSFCAMYQLSMQNIVDYIDFLIVLKDNFNAGSQSYYSIILYKKWSC